MIDTDFGLNFVSQSSFHETDEFQQLKHSFHEHLVDRVEDIGADFGKWSKDAVRQFVAREIEDYIRRQPMPLNSLEIQHIVKDLTNELTGLGPLEDLIGDDGIEDIFINGYKEIFISKNGQMVKSNVRFIDDKHVMRIVHRIVAPIGRRIDEANPMVDARLPDGSRVNVIIPPLALDGPAISIRKFRTEPLQAGDLLTYGTLTQEMLSLLKAAVMARCNILISGGTGAGKTTLLNVLAQYIHEGDRIVTIEDAAELRLLHEHVVRLETRPALMSQNEVSARDLMRNSLRMRPNRIILGEVRGGEAVELLQAMNTGHDGSMSTVHANSPREALHRLELLLNFGGFQGSESNVNRQLAGAIDFIVQISRLANGKRRITSISEVTGTADEVIVMQELFRLDTGSMLTPGGAADRWETAGFAPRTPKLAGYAEWAKRWE